MAKTNPYRLMHPSPTGRGRAVLRVGAAGVGVANHLRIAASSFGGNELGSP